MKKKLYVILGIITVIGIGIGIIAYFANKNMPDTALSEDKKEPVQAEDTNNGKEADRMNEIVMKVNGKELTVKLEDNTSASAFLEKLQDGEITIQAKDYGNFEKVGSLGFDLPTNDEKITTEAGDLILYQGNQITLYYDTNTWSFTKLGKVQDISKNELKSILGEGDTILTFSLNK